MNDATPYVSFFSEYLWLARAMAVIATSFALGVAAEAAYKGFWLWRHRNTPISDPVIAKALERIKPPRYRLHALGWLSLAGLIVWTAYPLF